LVKEVINNLLKEFVVEEKKCNTQIRWCFETAMVTVDTVMAKELCQGIAAGDLEACLKIAKCSIPDKSTKCLTGN